MHGYDMGKKERLRQYFAFLNRMTLSPGCKKGNKSSSAEHRFSAFKGLKANLMLNRRKPKPKAVFPKQSSDQSRSNFKDPPANCPDSTAGDSKPPQS